MSNNASNNQSPNHQPNQPAVVRYKASYLQIHGDNDTATSEYLNMLCMIFSMLGLMLKIKFCAWMAMFCSSINFANARTSDESKQIISGFMLSISAIVINYLQNPAPLTFFNTS